MRQHLYRVHRGKRTLLMTDERTKVADRLRQLRRDAPTVRGQAVRYVVEDAPPAAEKYRKKPDGHKRSGGDAQAGPPRI